MTELGNVIQEIKVRKATDKSGSNRNDKNEENIIVYGFY